MPKFVVSADLTFSATTEVEAETIEEAFEIAESDAEIAGRLGANAEYSSYRVTGGFDTDGETYVINASAR